MIHIHYHTSKMRAFLLFPRPDLGIADLELVRDPNQQ
jgi:hypothetical protein